VRKKKNNKTAGWEVDLDSGYKTVVCTSPRPTEKTQDSFQSQRKKGPATFPGGAVASSRRKAQKKDELRHGAHKVGQKGTKTQGFFGKYVKCNRFDLARQISRKTKIRMLKTRLGGLESRGWGSSSAEKAAGLQAGKDS